MLQRSDEWFTARLGKVTASRISEVLTISKRNTAHKRTKYMRELLCERLTGVNADRYVTRAMQRGIDLESTARIEYELRSGNIVLETGFFTHPSIKMAGASPDGLVGNDGLLEIKCPTSFTHLIFLQTGTPDEKYILQMQWQMACTGRQWCDFVSYDDNFPDNLAYRRTRISRDDTQIAIVEREVLLFLDELSKMELDLNAANFAA
ncbi:lambda exonuclease family protein [Snodgrassella alvi]|jgi:putative phage-type endonuclease|nr:lambda exonuclease family protein [Snodgrassella alvi]